MLTPIKKQGDEHIYILLQIGIIDWVSVRYMGIYRFVWMLIGSEITYRDALSILYEVHVKGNHADRDKILLKKSCHVITPAVAKARSAQVLRNSPLAMPLTGYPLTRGCPAGHLMMPCQSFGCTVKCKSTGILRCSEMSEPQRTESRSEGGEPHRLPRNLFSESVYFPDKLFKINNFSVDEEAVFPDKSEFPTTGPTPTALFSRQLLLRCRLLAA